MGRFYGYQRRYMSNGRYSDGGYRVKYMAGNQEIKTIDAAKPVSSVVVVEDKEDEIDITPAAGVFVVTPEPAVKVEEPVEQDSTVSKEEETGELPRHFTAFMPMDTATPSSDDAATAQEETDPDAE